MFEFLETVDIVRVSNWFVTVQDTSAVSRLRVLLLNEK